MQKTKLSKFVVGLSIHLILGAIALPLVLLAEVDNEIFDANQISLWHSNNGHLVSHVPNSGPGLEWPTGSNKHAVFSSGLWIVAQEVWGIQNYQSAAAEYTTEFVPGNYGGNPEAEANRVYSINSTDLSANPDWQAWPVDQGAPWIDLDSNDVWNPDVDQPDFKGNLFHWSVMNDGDASAHDNLFQTNPIGIEVKSSVFGFSDEPLLENVVFFSWDITNESETFYDVMCLGLWADPDVGYGHTDLVGCDPQGRYAYVYNEESLDGIYGYPSPALGYILLESPGALMSFNAFFNTWEEGFWDAESATDAFNLLQLNHGSDWFHVNPITQSLQPWVFDGDPVSGEGWNQIDYYPAQDCRFLMGTELSNFSSGETTTLTGAIVMAQGSSNIGSLAALYDQIDLVQDFWNQDLEMPADILRIDELSDHTNTESVGPFSLRFQIEEPDSVFLFGRSIYFRHNNEVGIVSLAETDPHIWEATIPIIDTDTTQVMDYWMMTFTENGEYPWPLGAPVNTMQFSFGPDVEPPILEGLDQVQDVHYLLPLARIVEIESISDNRHGVSDVVLNWIIGDSPRQSTEMEVFDSTEINFNMHYSYRGVITGNISAIDQEVSYWVTASDASQNANTDSTDVYTFRSTTQEALGAWDLDVSYQKRKYWEGFDNAIFTPFFSGEFQWGSVVQLNIASTGVSADTMTYTRPLDLTNFDAAWLSIPMAYQFMDAASYGQVQFHVDGVWSVRDTLTGISPPGEKVYDISEFIDTDDFSLRFTAYRESSVVLWLIDDIMLTSIDPSVGVDDETSVPQYFDLKQNYPNPFNPVTTINYSLPEQSDVMLVVYDIQGREVKNIVAESQPAGTYKVQWNGLDAAGLPVSSGMYFARLQAGEFSRVVKMVYLR
ncbi:MAG: T9SS type A sorting domain-containing protein [FCB group bacterium]|nr:T9SS type A sorting domain-containing protein [FCB group bacterium]MBL7027396.1 T9SS type A sorting domain-containing protein [Candidatus Neomarinimicrobiota bacterium]MBL7122653.1 T9SS type A sorting domain-containing protein [Candidatus Neomarinimicrobiota bacterium]